MPAKIYLYDSEYYCIGSGCLSAEYIQYQLQYANGEDIEVHINSLGGDAFQAVAIYNLLKSYSGKVTTFIDSVAASSAATIAMGGSEVVMSKYGMLMIHKPSTFTSGTSNDLQSDVSMLEIIQGNIVKIYMDKTGLDQEAVEAMVNATTWMDADLALEMKFVDRVEDYTEVLPAVYNNEMAKNRLLSTPPKFKQVVNKILSKQALNAPIIKDMTKEEVEAIVKPTNTLLTKVLNWFKGNSTKVTTNKGDRFIVGNLAPGANVFNDADMDEPADDEEDMEATNAAGKKVKMSVKNGKVTKCDPDEDEDDDEDDDIDADNKVVLNSVGVTLKKSTTRKVAVNSIAAKLKEVSNQAIADKALIVDLTRQLQVSNTAVQRAETEIRATIQSEFDPKNSQRSKKVGETEKQVGAGNMPKEGTVAYNAMQKAIALSKEKK